MNPKIAILGIKAGVVVVAGFVGYLMGHGAEEALIKPLRRRLEGFDDTDLVRYVPEDDDPQDRLDKIEAELGDEERTEDRA